MTEWLKIREDLPEDPAVLFVAEAVRLSADDVAGKMIRLWRWARHATADGFVPGAKPGVVDKLLGRKGFAAALASVPGSPWLLIEHDGLRFPKWDRHNERAAKERALATERKRKARASGRDSSVTDVTPDRDQNVTVEKTRREETKEQPASAPAAAPAPSPAKPPRKPPTGPHAEFIAWWEAEYERTQGTAYVGAWAKDGPAVSRALKLLGPAELRARATRWLASDDAWIAGTARGLALFVSQINLPALRGLEPPRADSADDAWLSVTGALDLAARDDYDGANARVGPRAAATVKACGGWTALRRASAFDAQRMFKAAWAGARVAAPVGAS